MKRLIFKKWVLEVLYLICFISVLVMASDCDNMKAFIISHIVSVSVLVGCGMLLRKYGKTL